MSREIKFRAWVFGGLDDGETAFMTDVRSINRDFDQWIIQWTEYNEWSNASEYHLMQYTGLKDKKGIEIYEGDVCASQYFKPCAVEYRENISAFTFSGATIEECAIYDDNEWEIIGNIHQNPELLND